MKPNRSTRWCCALAGALMAGAGFAQAPDPPTQAASPAASPPVGPIHVQPEEGEAGPEPIRPRAAARIVRAFDFEEQLTNPLDIPKGWIRAQHDALVPRIRPDYPIWNRARLDYKVAAHGEGSVRLPVRGGNASLRLEPGVVPIFPLGQYEITALVRTTNLSAARPRLVVRALDSHSEPIEGSERAAILMDASEGWHPLGVILPGLFADAAFLQIDLEVVQPATFEKPTLAEHQVWESDFDGMAWFDDVTVMQMPQLSMHAQSPLGIVARPLAPELTVEIRDLAAEDMTATIRLYDAKRHLVDATSRTINVGRSKWTWAPAVDQLGWYRAVVNIVSGGRVIASSVCDLAWVDAADHAGPQYGTGPAFSGLSTSAKGAAWRPFMVELTRLPPGSPAQLASAADALRIDAISLPVWEAPLQAETLRPRVEAIRQDLAALRAEWIDGELALAVLPESLVASTGARPDQVVPMLATDEVNWGPFLLEALDKLGDTNSRWMLGVSGSTALEGIGPIDAPLASARKALGKFVPGVEIGIGWRADMDPAAGLTSRADRVMVELPSWMGGAPLEAVLLPWQDGHGPVPTFVLEPLPLDQFTERAAAADLARRTVELWRTATADGRRDFRVGIRDPWTLEEGEEVRAQPSPASGVWRALSDRLAGRVFAADWRIGKGMRCMLFVPDEAHPERGGMLAAWNETAPSDRAEFIATLADGPVRVADIFGNERLLEATSSEDGARREHRVALSEEPIFIEDIDTSLVEFLASVQLDPPLIQSLSGEHEHNILLRNPWGTPVNGRVIVTEPGGFVSGSQARDRTWQISPRSMDFDIPSGDSESLPILLSFSRSIEAGQKDFVFDIHVVGERDYGWVRARAFAELTWNDVAMELSVRPAAAGPDADLIVEATITNTGEQVRSFDAVAYASGMSRVRSSVGSLKPGETIVRRFPFVDAYDALGGGRVMVSLSEPDGPGRLTRSVEIPRR
ncbi:MAG: hypothetical protein IPJ41_17285 [Phycisphaerales bacterium]|nr:hypothetical protein [Phycisphaerales bacterium]